MAPATTAHHVIAAHSAALSPLAPVRPAPTAATYRWRRLVVLLATAAAVVLSAPVASRAAAAFRDVPASVPARRPAPAADTSRPSGGYLVQPGDTLWAVARRMQPTGDLRPLVDQLVALNGGTALEVGQVLVIP